VTRPKCIPSTQPNNGWHRRVGFDLETVQTVKYVPYLPNAAIRQHGQELVASISGHEIRSTGGPLQSLPKASEYLVSNSMTILIIYLFEDTSHASDYRRRLLDLNGDG